MERASSTIISSNLTVVAFFKDREQDEVDEILVSLIGILEKMGSIGATVSATATEEEDHTVAKKCDENSVRINKYVLAEINKEYIDFLHNRDGLVGLLRDTAKQSMGMVDSMRMPYLEKYICETFDSGFGSKITLTNQFKCELCNYYICSTRKALSAHQRGCKKIVGSL